jgi:hypothetical protein
MAATEEKEEEEAEDAMDGIRRGAERFMLGKRLIRIERRGSDINGQ